MHARRLVDAQHGTLGALLYATAETVTTEDEWAHLVRSVAEGDQAALRELYARTHRLVFTLAIRVTMDRQTAEEVTVDVFHDVWRRAGSYDPADGTVLGWIMNQARSRAIDRVRHVSRMKRTAPEHHDPSDAPPRPPVPDDTLATKRESVRLRSALEGLTVAEKEAIETAFFSGLTYEETAARLEQPVGTIKTRIRSGLAKLREALGERGAGT